ncbi:transcriptional elongation regulator MINIYO [Silene latifolia]|uniref:transcriptional elongation regulator MINIYO n=1 Tax=Silene latifolia TaxID=37657 RepID=UPI003D77A8B1
MEKQRNNNGGKPPKKQPKQRVFGANAFHLSEETSSQLIGGIVEKGIISDNFTTPSSTSSFPLTSPLPFPVARHRSHGPHWTPVGQLVTSGGGGDDDGNYDEENDPTNYDPLANFAKPIETKKKKGLDLSRWKEVIRSDVDSNIQAKDNTMSMRNGVKQQKTCERMGRNFDNNSLVNEQSMDIDNNSTSDLPESQLERSPYNEVDMGFEDFSSTDMVSIGDKYPSSTSESSRLTYGQGDMGLESQIDAENRELLKKMSPEEIAEAQAELRNRLNPELLNLLKKRGTKKLEKKGSSGLSSNAINLLGDKQADGSAGGDEVSVRESTSRLPTQTMPKLQTKPDEGIVQDPVSKGSSEWSSWSKRVEAVRNLRFSLDGNVIEGSSLSPTYSVDNVAERDFLRTEGDPAAAGYTVKEALALARSVIPGQRTLAWHLLETILSKALQAICRSELDCMTKVSDEMHIIDWEALWAYALGPEPELALSLRLAIDDNHTSVTLASAKVIRCILSCDLNEKFFNSTVKLARMDLYTAPVFRCRPDIKHGFFGGGFWKYSTKPSNILSPDEEVMNDKNEGERTIQDDNVIASQDVAAGLVRMESLHRFRFLLETEPSAASEECILSILVAVARHSPTCANAVWKFERLVQTIVDRFKRNDMGAKVKSVTLLKVLAQSSKIICMDFIEKGFFQVMTWQLCRVTPFINEWVKFGPEKSKLASQLMVEQLRFWKVCVMYGYCISSFTGFFPALCVFLSPPTFDKLTETNVFNEFASITTETYLVLKSLADTLPDPYSSNIRSQQFPGASGTYVETWCWNDVCPMVNSALQWLQVRYDTTLPIFFDQLIGVDNKSIDHNTSASSLLWILSAIMHFLQTVLLKATPADILVQKGCSTKERILPELVSKLALQIINNGIFNFSDENEGLSRMSDLVDKLCYLRQKPDPEVSLAAVWCLNTLVRLVLSADHLVFQTQGKVGYKLFEGLEASRGRKILHDGIFKSSLPKWEKVVDEFMNIVTSEWHHIRQIEVFGRGGPAPGVGVGWGALGGGFWGVNVVAFQADARLFIELLGPWLSSWPMDLPDEENKFMVKIVNSALASSLMVGPGDKMTLQKIFDILLEVPVLKYLNQHILHFLRRSLGKESLEWENNEDDLLQFCKILASHFTDRWLDEKKKKEKNPEMKGGPHIKSKSINGVGNSLGTIPEEEETSNVVIREDSSSLMVEWARQRMPLPSYWLLSPITTISSFTEPSMQNTAEFLQVAKAGLFLLLGIEAMSSCLPNEDKSPVRSIPLIWRLHSLSVPLLAGKGVLEEEKSRDMFEALQSLYGQHLDELQLSSINDGGCLRFQTEIHENYSTFLEALVEQFAAVSYGDVIYGRQISIYLHRQVESSVRLAAWNTLSNARVLELLPPLDKCVSRPEGYLEPVEDDAAILEAYAKSWVSGALDRSVRRGSVSYTIALHHLSSFIFSSSGGDKSLLRNKIVKSILRDYSRKRQHEGMMLDLIKYNSFTTIMKSEENVATLSPANCTGPRLEVLKEACEGNSQLLTEVDKLKSATQPC